MSLRTIVASLAASLLLSGSACSKRDTPVATREMSRALVRDARVSQTELTALEDSLYRLLGDSMGGLLKRADTSWADYRTRECDAIRVAFAQGSIAPVAQMECLVELTDDRSLFLRHEYNFAK